MSESEASNHELETGLKPEPAPNTVVADLPIHYQTAFRFRMFGLFALRLLVVTAFILMLERLQPLAQNFKSAAVDNAYLFVLLSLVAVVLVLTGILRPIAKWLKWLLVLALVLSESVLVATIDAINDNYFGLLFVAFTVCTVLTMALLGLVTYSDPKQLLNATATFGIAFGITAAAIIALYAGNALDLTPYGLKVLIVGQFLVAGWTSMGAPEVYSLATRSELVESMAAIYYSALKRFFEMMKQMNESQQQQK